MAQSTEKARKAVVKLGDIPLDVYQLPNGDYRLYSASVAEVIEKRRRNLYEFLNGKSPEALPYKDLNLCGISDVLVEGKGNSIKPIPVEVAIAYWRYWDKKGNQKAGAIISACIAESIERRADLAFGIGRNEEERQDRFAQHLTPEAMAEQQEMGIALEVELEKLRIEKLKLEKESKQADLNLIQFRHLIVQTCPEPIQQKVLGYQTVEKVERIETVIDRQTGEQSKGIGITYVAKALGFKNNKAAWDWLESVDYGKESGRWHSELSAVHALKLSREDLQYLKDIFPESNRQMFLGE